MDSIFTPALDSSNLFKIANNIALIAWLLLIIAPRWKWTSYIVRSGLVSLLFAALYLVLLLPNLSGFSLESFGSLEGVTQLFARPDFVLIGWVHYLAFDLWVGIWEVGDAQRRGISHFLVVPCLFFTFMFGPVGLLFYLVIRNILSRGWLMENV